MASQGLESKNLLLMSEPLVDLTRHLETVFPQLEWDLKRSGYTISAPEFLAVSLYLALVFFIGSFLLLVAPFIFSKPVTELYPEIFFCITISILALAYFMFMPRMKIARRAKLIDRDLEYVLKDIHIQLTAGVPLFDTFVNIARGDYGECSIIATGIVREVQSGKSMAEVLDNVGMWSPSEYLRESLWQIVNALSSGADVSNALNVISLQIRAEKRNKIKAYAKELNLWGLIYMMGGVVFPSMGVTLLVILSSFLGESYVHENLLWVILFLLVVFQVAFITFVKDRRPIV
ncbi:MAG TPA: type II secretion system F family protein [Candidatus Altiarchaeales archaeon]|nr:type II secretion system F family protein [Candidatus Altiarchaeales archaeon]